MGSQTGSYAQSQGHKQGHTCRHRAIHGVTCIVMGAHVGSQGPHPPLSLCSMPHPHPMSPPSPCPHRVVEVLDGELGEPLRHQLLLAAGGDLLEPGEGPRCPGGTQVLGGEPGGQEGPRVQGGGTPRGDLGIPGGTQASGGDLGGPRGTQRTWVGDTQASGGTQAWRTAAAPGRPPAEPPGERSRRLGRSSSRPAASSGCRNTSGAGPGGRGWSDGAAWTWGHPGGIGTPQETWGHPGGHPRCMGTPQSCSQSLTSAL